MKKTLFLPVIITISVFLFNSCQQKTIRTIHKTYSNTVYLSNDTAKGSFSISVSVDLPVCFHNKAILDSILKTLNRNLFGNEFAEMSVDTVVNVFAVNMIDDYLRTNKPILAEMEADTVSGFMGGLFNSFEIEGFSLLNNKKIYGYGINKNIYMGGAHGMYSTYYYNFNLETGKVIVEDDLFLEGYENPLTELIKQKILEYIQFFVPEITSLDESDYFENTIKPNGNFYINEESINYLFNPYEIAPFSYGQTEISLPITELTNLLKNKSILEK